MTLGTHQLDSSFREPLPVQVGNRLIASLPRKERERLLDDCALTVISPCEVLHRADNRVSFAYFILDGCASLLVPLDGHPPVEVGLIGAEGMLGSSLVLGISEAALLAVVQSQGHAWRINATLLRRHLTPRSRLQRVLRSYLHVQVAQQARMVACTHFHAIEARLSRWLLMSHDRAHSGQFRMTHQLLADALGVQRGAVTLAAGNLQRLGYIRYVRGNIKVLSRHGLESSACDCYSAMIADYTRQFPIE